MNGSYKKHEKYQILYKVHVAPGKNERVERITRFLKADVEVNSTSAIKEKQYQTL